MSLPITWDFVMTIAVTAIITNIFAAITQIFMYKFLFNHVALLMGLRNGKGPTSGKDEAPAKKDKTIDDWPNEK
jgi:hypothetical protein